MEVEQAQIGRALLVHSLAALSGQGTTAYETVTAPTLDLERALDLPPTLPADLLAHRPDVAAAKARIAAAQAGREASHAAFYPNVNLIGFVGFAAVGLEQLPKGDSQTWTVGPALTCRSSTRAELKADTRKAGADLDVAVASYNEIVLRAVRE